MSVLQYFDEVEKKLTLLTNKTIMTHEGAIAESICTKYRADALRVFISGLKRPLCDILFASRPDDLPSALALAQEVESNRERYVFATSFAASASSEDPNRFKKANGNADQRMRTPQRNPHFLIDNSKETITIMIDGNNQHRWTWIHQNRGYVRIRPGVNRKRQVRASNNIGTTLNRAPVLTNNNKLRNDKRNRVETLDRKFRELTI